MKHLVAKYLREHPKPARATAYLFCDLYGISGATFRRRMKEQGITWGEMYRAELRRRMAESEASDLEQLSNEIGAASCSMYVFYRRHMGRAWSDRSAA